MTLLLRRALPPYQWAQGVALSTALFAAGQAAGPVFTGFLADRAGGLYRGLIVSTVLLALAAIAAGRQRPPVPEAD
jgi:MFS family permease